MAKVWFVRRVGGRWVVPGGTPAYELPLQQIIFKLDLGWQRRLDDGAPPEPLPGPPPDLKAVKKVFVEVSAADIEGALFSGYKPGWYDSPYTPAEAARRLGAPRWSVSTAATPA